MALNDNALVTLDQAKKHLRMETTFTAQDENLEVFINAASAKIERYCERQFKAKDYTHLFTGDATGIVQAKEWPVNSVASVMVDKDRLFTNPAKTIPSDKISISDDKQDVYLDHNMGLLRGSRIIKMTYNAGYTTLPGDLHMAALLTVEWLYTMRSSQSLGRSSVSKGDETVSYADGLPQAILNDLFPHKRQEFAQSEVGPDRY